jgi:energy-coupling factor transporter ATP-binding protein EcfA2
MTMVVVVVVTHKMGFAREVADSLVFIDEGRIIEAGCRARCWPTRSTSAPGRSCPRSCRARLLDDLSPSENDAGDPHG